MKKKELNEKKEYVISLGLFLLAVMLSLIFSFTDYNLKPEKTFSFTGYLNLVVEQGDNQYSLENYSFRYNKLSSTDILAYANLPKEVSQERIKIYRIVNNSHEEVSAQFFDTNDNGLINYIEWITPHLSNQTFEIIIITKAEHLSSNKTFISDIYEQVKSLDNIWSETISDGDYVRVTFEIPLDNKRDITIY